MNKCQELIDKVSEFRYLKVRERQMNKFNRLLHKKERNVTWLVPTSTQVNSTLLAVSVSSPQAGSASPQAIIVASQAGRQLANNNRQAVNANIVSSSQTGSQGTGSFNSANNNNPQAVSANSQGTSAVPPQAGSPQTDSVGSQAVSADFQGTSTVSQGEVVAPRQAAQVPRQAVLPMQVALLPRATTPRQLGLGLTITRVLPDFLLKTEGIHWKILT